MKLISLTLENFKGIKKFELKPDGKSVSVYGDNATGKTTIADAQAWLLFDRDSKFTAGFSPKRKGEDGEDVHNIVCTVEGVYALDDGTQITLSKAHSEVWKAKRGSNEKTFSGHTTIYSVDGVPRTEKEFGEIISEIASPSDMMILTSPFYFSETLKKQDRRQVLLSMTGCCSEWEVIENTAELVPLKEMLRKPKSATQFYSVEEFSKVCKADNKALNARLKEIPARIDELSKTVSDVQIDDSLIEKKNGLSAEKIRLNILLNASHSEKVSEIRAEIAEVRAQMQTDKAEALRILSEKNSFVEKEIETAKASLLNVQKKINVATNESYKARIMKNQLIDLRNDTLSRFDKVSKTQWSGHTICPTCNQPIPEAEIEKAKENFNLEKSKKMEEIRKYGSEYCSKDMIAEQENRLSEAETRISELNHEREVIEAQINTLKEKIIPFEFDEKPYMDNIEMLEIRAKAFEKNSETENAEIREKIVTLDNQIEEIDLILLKDKQNKEITQRISELEDEEKQLGIQLAKTAQGIELCEKFIKAKVSMLTERINGLFETVKFRLFKTQINGGIEDDCEVMIPSGNNLVPFSSANNAARINAGIEIISAYSKFKKTSMPVFVDNAESITDLQTKGLQVIRLVVSENDKTLRTEEF